MVGIGAVSGGHFTESASGNASLYVSGNAPRTGQGYATREHNHGLCRAWPAWHPACSGRKAQESVIENSVNLQVAGKPPVSTSSTP